VIQIIERANVNLKKEAQHLQWICSLATKWKFLPWSHEIPPWGGIPPRLGTTGARQFETVFCIDIEVAFRWKDTKHSPLKNVLTKQFIHNLQSNMQEKF